MDASIAKIKIWSRGLSRLQEDILHLINQEKKIRRKIHRTDDYKRTVTLKAILRNLNRIVSERIALLEGDLQIRKLEGIVMNCTMHRKLKNLAGIAKRTKVPALKDPVGQNVESDVDKTEALAGHFANIGVHRNRDLLINVQ